MPIKAKKKVKKVEVYQMVEKSKQIGSATKAIHAGEESLPKTGPLTPPIHQNSTFRFATAEECVSAFTDEDTGYVYTRWGNPTQSVLERKIAVLEGGEAALATASGMAAVSTALLTILENGDHVVAMDSLYSASHNFLDKELQRMGIETTFVDATHVNQIKRAIQPNTKAIYIESPANPTLKLVDMTCYMRDHLDIAPQESPLALALQDGGVHLSGGDEVWASEVLVEHPLVGAQVHVALGAISEDEDLAMSEGVERAGVDVQIALHLDGGD